VPLDLNVRVPSSDRLKSYIEMADKLGLTGFATSLPLESPITNTTEGVVLLARTDLDGRRLESTKRQLVRIRRQSAVIALPLTDIEVSNWAAEDRRVDLLTVADLSKEHIIRQSTANLAAESEIALEIPIAPLLETCGLDRSKVLRVYRESVATAMSAGMKTVLSSCVSQPIMMRAPSAMWHIGILLGMDKRHSRQAVYEVPDRILSLSERKRKSETIAPGIDLIQEDE